MKFMRAMELTKQGFKVHRTAWPTKNTITSTKQSTHKESPVWIGKFNEVGIYLPKYEDIAADDWEVVVNEGDSSTPHFM